MLREYLSEEEWGQESLLTDTQQTVGMTVMHLHEDWSWCVTMFREGFVLILDHNRKVLTDLNHCGLLKCLRDNQFIFQATYERWNKDRNDSTRQATLDKCRTDIGDCESRLCDLRGYLDEGLRYAK